MKRVAIGVSIGILICATGAASAPSGKFTHGLYFEPNRGQAHAAVQFIARGSSSAAYLSDREAILRVGRNPVRMQLVGAARAAGEPLDRLPGVASYFNDNDPGKWQAGVPMFGRVRYANVYPGIDIVYYGAGDSMEYDFVVAPGADASRIRLRYVGARGLHIDEQGDLVAQELRQRRPRVYQEVAGERREVRAAYRIAGDGEVRFEVGEHASGRPLVIDPVFEFGTYFGGAAFEDATAVKVDASGNVYVAGSVYTPSSDADPFGGPLVFGKAQVAVFKYSPSGKSLLYFVHIGEGPVDTALGLAIDASGSAYVVGHTSSPSFPLVNAFQTQFKINSYPLFNGFVAKIAPDGKSLVYSSYLGGSSLGEKSGTAGSTVR